MLDNDKENLVKDVVENVAESAPENDSEKLAAPEKLVEKIINILFLSGEEISIKTIANILKTKEEYIEEVLDQVKLKINETGLVFFINENSKNREVSVISNPEFFDILKEFTSYELSGELTPAALQTLTIVAYMKRVTPAEVSFIRGVQSTQTLRALSTRGLIKRENDNDSNTKREVYVLTSEAMHHLGISKHEELPDYENLVANLNQKLADALNG